MAGTGESVASSGELHEFLRAKILQDFLSTFDNSNQDAMVVAVECADAVFLLTSWARTQYVGTVLQKCMNRAKGMRRAVSTLSKHWRNFVVRRDSHFSRILQRFNDYLTQPHVASEHRLPCGAGDLSIVLAFAPEVIVTMYSEQRRHYLHALARCRGCPDQWNFFPPFVLEMPFEQILEDCRLRHASTFLSKSADAMGDSILTPQSLASADGASPPDPPLVILEMPVSSGATPRTPVPFNGMWTNDRVAMAMRRNQSQAVSSCSIRSPSDPSDIQSVPSYPPFTHREDDVTEGIDHTIPVAVPIAIDSSELKTVGQVAECGAAAEPELRDATPRQVDLLSPDPLPPLTAETPICQTVQIPHSAVISSYAVCDSNAQPTAADAMQSHQSADISRSPMKGYSKRHMLIRPYAQPLLAKRTKSPPMFTDASRKPSSGTSRSQSKAQEETAQTTERSQARNRTQEIFNTLEAARTPALSEILGGVDGSVIIQGRIRALQKLLRGTRRQHSSSNARPGSPSSHSATESDTEEDWNHSKISRPGSPATHSSDFILKQSPTPCTVPVRALTPAVMHRPSSRTASASPAAMLVPPCMRRCLTPVERHAVPITSCPETRICVPRFKKATETLTPADVCRLRQQRETAKCAASYERGSHVALRIRTALGRHEDQGGSQQITELAGALQQSLSNRARRGQSVDLSLFPTVVGAELRLVTQEELKILRAAHVKQSMA
jgi:hypothetical protein